ncbi:MAG: hypothetical protein BJ554DRAFT_3500 [Olpidium bornovanus]|uniref:Uncharacterized protein n=1 Tax=Olpidium bornovanus TaxID=278681 RepID=A0A8H7ZNP6_9FUNG|nr:MAG: hypothetical protein BJ554DRAFT_3500 [Olpidium bornovanus]
MAGKFCLLSAKDYVLKEGRKEDGQLIMVAMVAPWSRLFSFLPSVRGGGLPALCATLRFGALAPSPDLIRSFYTFAPSGSLC